MIKRFIILVSLFVLFANGYSQKVSISGYVTDEASGEKIIGAAVITSDHLNYAVSNSYGYYILILNSSGDSVRLQASYVGYSPAFLTIRPDQDMKINFNLNSGNILNEVVVSAERSTVYERERK